LNGVEIPNKHKWVSCLEALIRIFDIIIIILRCQSFSDIFQLLSLLFWHVALYSALLIRIDRLLWLTWSLIDLNTAVSRTSAWGLLVSATWSQCVRIRCQRACCGPHDGPKLVKADVSYKPTWRMSTSACPLIRPYAWCALMGGLFTRNTARKIENYREILKMS